MTRVLTVRIAPGLLAKAEARATQLGLDRAGYLRNLEARLCFGIRCSDVNGTPKVFARALYAAARLREPGDLLDLELMVAAHRRGVRVIEVPVRGFSRHGGRSSTTLKSAWLMYRGALRLRLDRPGD